MATCASLSNGYLVANELPIGECTGFVLISPAEFAMNYQQVEIGLTEFSAAASAAFGFVIVAAALAYKVKVAKRSIKMM